MPGSFRALAILQAVGVRFDDGFFQGDILADCLSFTNLAYFGQCRQEEARA